MRAKDLKFEEKQTRTLGGFEVTVLDVNHKDIEEASSLKNNSLMALQQAKQDIEQKRAEEIAAWEQDFRTNTAKMASQQLKKRFEPVPVARPGEKHATLKARLNNLNQAIQKQSFLDALSVRAEKMGLLNDPGLKADIDTRLLIRNGPTDDYAALNQHLDTAIARVKDRIKQRRVAYAKPKRMAEELNEFAPPGSNDGGGESERSRRLRKLLEIAIQVAKEKNVDELGMIHAMNTIAGDEFFNVAVEGILPDITDKEYMFVLETAYKTVKQGMAEAIKLNAPQRKIPRDELQGYADRIKTGTKTKRDKFSPIIHGSNIKAIVKDEDNTEWDLDDLARQITTRPRAILGTNAKMEKSATEGEIVYDLTLPALSGIVVDEETGDFVEITTCPGAGACQLFCYARKGGYVMFPASSMSAAQALNFLVNDPEGYSARVNQEIQATKKKADKHNIQLVVRWHDAGDFFSKEYLDLAFEVARANPDVEFYAYTKIADVATANKPDNFIINFSSGSKRGEEKKVEFHKSAGNVVKQGVTIPKDMFFDLIARDGAKLIKDAKGRTQFKDHNALNEFKRRIAIKYNVNPATIITYDQMLATPVGTEPKWNVIVQPGAGDRAANRKDVIDSYLMFH
jgi:hypothetical protein